MKIACPECGQHYEVDASMLDRYFRCTECKTLFRGLNAKSVKVQQFKRKKRKDGDAVNESSNPDAADPGDTTAAVVLESDELAKATVDIDGEEMPEAKLVNAKEQFDDEEAISEARQKASLVVDWNRVSVIAAMILALLALILVLVGNARINSNADALAQSQAAVVELEKNLDATQQQLRQRMQEIRALQDQLESIESRLATQVAGKSDVVKRFTDADDQFNHINNRITELMKAFESIDDCKVRLEELEKLTESVRRRRVVNR